ncbi:MAG: sulfite exporter TauE/SafE family protein [Planctomycetota bacterium]|jgi:uncharacterized membrane protein YfcA
MIFAALGGIAVGLLLGLLGSGGSIAAVPILVYLVGMPEKSAIASSLAIVGGIALAGALRHRQGDLRAVLWFGLPGMVGSYLGAIVSGEMSASMQMTLFAAVMAVAAFGMLLRRDEGDGEGRGEPNFKLVAAGLGVGVLTGIVGVGGGFLIVPALVLLAKLPTRRAIGTSLWIIALQSFAGFAKHATMSPVDYQIVGLFLALGIAGSVAGTTLSQRIPQVALRHAFGWFVLVMAGIIAATNV